MAAKRFLNLDEKREKKAEKSRFVFVEDKTIEEKIAGRIPKTTVKNTNWAISIWDEWADARNEKQTNTEFPVIPRGNTLAMVTDKQMEFFLSRFIFEIRRKDGNPYPPATLLNIVAGIQRHLRESGKHYVNVLDKSDQTFFKFRSALDARMKELTAQGIGTLSKQAETVTLDQEKGLWDKGIFSLTNSQGLVNAVFYYTSKVFGLRSGDEHRSLRVSQFEFGENETGKYIQFNGGACKTKSGGLATLKKQFKQVLQYKDENNPRSYYNILAKYLEVIPKNIDAFYFRPAACTQNELMFSNNIIGKNTLDKCVTTMMKAAGFVGYFTNHSIKATMATELYNKGYDEQLIQERTGHTSNAVRKYKRTSDGQQKQISNELDPPKPNTSSLVLTAAESEEVKEINSIIDNCKNFFDDEFKSQSSPAKKSKLSTCTCSSTPKKELHYNLRSTPIKLNKTKVEKSNATKSNDTSNLSRSTNKIDEMVAKTSEEVSDTGINTYYLRSTPKKKEFVSANSISELSMPDKMKQEDRKVQQLNSMISYQHKKYDIAQTHTVSILNNGENVDLCGECGNVTNQFGNFDLNLADFLGECSVKAKDIHISGVKNRKGGQLIIKIDY